MSERVIVIDEPTLQFAGNQTAIDPHDGLALFGPFSAGTSSHPQSPGHIVLAGREGLDLWRHWSALFNRPAAVPEFHKHTLWPPFPGFEVAMATSWPEQPLKEFELDTAKLLDASRLRDPHERCFAVVEQYLSCFASARKLDAKVSVAVCIVPDEVWQNCRPESRVANPVGRSLPRAEKAGRRAGQMNMFEKFDPQQYSLSPDFRRQLKARTMGFDIPVQIIRQSTLRPNDESKFGERGLTPLSDRLWNLGTALYYKSGGKPWKLGTARDGVCYIGIAFRLAEDERTACCAAQMFLDSGDGIVFLGEYGPWWSEEKKSFHLTRQAAEKLLSGVLTTYADLDGRPLKEIFLHCRSWLSDDEFAGYQAACPEGCKLVGVRVKPDRFGPRLFRVGEMPVLRGTFWEVNERTGYLFGSGFKPRIGTYDGWETPVPLRIDVQYGEASIETVARDILGLTKLNYNACRSGESQPVTVGFSDAVGEILVSNPTVTERRANFKFYI
jgi:hypothetical protein